MPTPTTDNDYNAASREIQLKLLIYFNEEPLVVTRDDYLITATLLEEVQSNSQSILGQVSSNELGFDLYNDTKIFTPTNEESPYYGKIRKNVKVVAYGRVTTGNGDTEWDELGTYYVKYWSTNAAGMIASVTANDKLYDVLDAPLPYYKVSKDVVIKDFYTDYFKTFKVDVNFKKPMYGILPWAYIDGDNKSFINNLTDGTLAFCYCNRQDSIDILPRKYTAPLRATLTDDDQIIDVKFNQTIDAGYDGASVVCNSKQESANYPLVVMKDQVLSPGSTSLTNLLSSVVPIIRLNAVRVDGTGTVIANSVTSTTSSISVQLHNEESEELSVGIEVSGTYLETVSFTDSDNGTNLLAIDSDYIQTMSQSNAVKAYLSNAAHFTNPLIEVTIRGNFKLKLGDKIRIRSTKYKTDFTGILIRNDYRYSGGLSCVITLMDARIFEGVK